MKVIYIAGLGHSGSTLLDLLLSAHPRIVGVGELHQWIAAKRGAGAEPPRHPCSCGQALGDCPIWSEYLAYRDAAPDDDFASRYRKMLEILERHYGPDVILSDSSKYVRPMRRLLEERTAVGLDLSDIKVLHLVKDVRNYAYSQKKRLLRSRKGGKGRWQGPSWWTDFRCFRQWRRRNLRVEKNLAATGAQAFRIGYEELCFYPERMLAAICDFVGVEFDPVMLDPARSAGHIAAGNGMQLHPRKSQKICYDHRWFTDNGILFQYGLQRCVRRYNEERVYGNVKEVLEARTFEPY